MVEDIRHYERRHLHKFLLRSLEELVDHVEELLFVDLIVEVFKEILNGSEVCLDLLLGVLVHAALDLADISEGGVLVRNIEHVIEISGEVLSNLVAAVKDGEIFLLEPLTWHLVLILGIRLHGSNVNVVSAVDDIQLSQDTGHVADLVHMLLHLSLKFFFKTVIESKRIISVSSESHLSHHFLPWLLL